jgi:SAM-dependent methyltransferase
MKTVVSLQELVDVEIRPDRLFDEFRELTRSSVAALTAGDLVEASCQGCGSRDGDEAFTKVGLTYRECRQCGSVFVSPRPRAAALVEYYRSSPAARFWRERVLQETLAARREKLAEPRAEWVADGLAEQRPQAEVGADVSPRGAMLVEALAALVPDVRLDPVPAEEGDTPAPASVDFVTAFDAFDRAADLPAYVERLRAALRPGGVLFLTAPTISGFDLQVLWDRSPAVLPPDKLNLLSIEGFRRLFAAGAWEIVELSTPGMFDVENVRHVIEQDPGGPWPRAIRRLIGSGENARLELQEYLQRHRLASFARLVVRRS